VIGLVATRRRRLLLTAAAVGMSALGGLSADQFRGSPVPPSAARRTSSASVGASGGTGPGMGASAGTGSPATNASTEPGSPDTPSAWSALVRTENARPGTPNWRIGSTAGKTPGLEVYADRISVRPGEQVGLYVQGSGPVAVRALRMGDYGGAGARQVWTGTLTASPQPTGTAMDGAIPDAGGIHGTHMVVAAWQRSGMVDTTGWPEGHYLLRLDAARASRYVPLTVRSAYARGRLLIVASAMTWQAYNKWGGGSLYDGDDGRFSDRSLAVSFDRPYADGFGSGRFMTYDEPIVTLAERAGLPLAWATDYDLANDPGLMKGATGIVIGGHAEYWTGAMRDAVTSEVAAGANLAIFGANTAYWRVRLAGRQIGLPGQPDRRDGRPRIIVGAKNAARDPLAARDPGGATARFRDAPAPRPEEALTGMRYDCFPAETSWTVVDPTWWGYAGADVRPGEKLDGVVGPEADRVYPVPTRPRPEEIVAYQVYSCGPSARTAHTGVYWAAASGAGVFTAGTMRWPCATVVGCTGVPGTRSAAVVSQVTTNVLTAFAQPLAGRQHPAIDNVAHFPLPLRATTHAT
jgi:hypothetical protein